MTYKDFTTEQINALVIKAQEGDERSRETLLKAYYSLAQAMAIKYRKTTVDVDDATSVAWIAVNKAINKYKLESKASFNTCASNCMRNAIFDLNRKESDFTDNTELDDGDNLLAQLDDVSSLESSPEEFMSDEVLNRLIMEEMHKLFTSEELLIIKYYLIDKKIADISELVQKTEQEINKVIRKYKTKLQEIRKRLDK